jgi:hypothetical protein
MDNLSLARKILNNKSLLWLELDITFPLKQWQEEAKLAESYYQEYRDSDSRGWSSCCLHGLGVDKIYTADNYGYHEYSAPYSYTELSEKCPTITNFWKNHFPAERYTRIRFMKLAPQGQIDWHNDGSIPSDIDPLESILPINLAIVHPDECGMMIEDKLVPWKEGKIFLINISKQHMVFNNSQMPRIHMIANIVLGNQTKNFCDMLVRCYNSQYGQV